ncbi:DUF2637 domain-containing protein [Kitasatospora sp. NPDC050543]|uniref:DUF2637 domain-containing protein n=1 Tax=Kitasatospora sp. NPDC050543 TaxID=3364054 RepID=UPI0037A914C4
MARPSLTRTHRSLLGVVAAGACLISGIGFAGSYNAVRELASEKGFGAFSYAFPIGVDAGIVVLLALDLVLTWLRIPFPLLRQTAWVLTVATIAFNAAASWGDPLGMGMHAVIPVLFVVVVEASRHAVGRIAAITADRHMESVRLMRWLLSPVPTFRLWRRMKLWELRSYDEVVRLEQNRLVYRAQLRFRYGRGWRRSAPIQALLPLKLAKYGMPLDLGVLDRLDAEAAEVAAARDAKEVQAAVAAQAIAAVAPGGQAAIPAGPAGVGAGVGMNGTTSARTSAAPTAAVGASAAAAEGTGPVAAVAADLAVPTLAKLAAVRLRDAQEPAQAEEQAPLQVREELNVWTERAVRSHAQQSGMGGGAGRVPGQASPWFKPPRAATQPGPEIQVQSVVPRYVADDRADRADQGERPAFEQQQPAPAVAPAKGGSLRLESRDLPEQPEPVRSDDTTAASAPTTTDPDPAPHKPVQREADRLDPELCFEALVTYIDTYEDQPDQQRLAEYLTSEYGVVGTRADGSVSPEELNRIWPALRARYASAGRD